MPVHIELLTEVRRITEYRDGDIWATEHVKWVWLPVGEDAPDLPSQHFYAPPPSNHPIKTHRVVKFDS